MKSSTCKKCLAPNLYWSQQANGRWFLFEESGVQHRCESDSLKAVKCKYCNAEDLHWAEDLKEDGSKKAVLTESYGLPHACDERIAILAREKQEKKDTYEAFKKKVNETPDGKCQACNGTGNGNSQGAFGSYCVECYGHGAFNAHTRRAMLANKRNQIWPSLDVYRFKRWR